MNTTVHKITSEEDLATFVECYDRAFGGSFLSAEFLRGCEDVFLFRDSEGNPIGGYSINTQLAYRLLSVIPAQLAEVFRARTSGLETYELGTIWVDPTRRNSREKLEVWLHVFQSMIARANTVMVGATISEEIYNFYARYGMKLAYFGPMNVVNDQYTDGWIVYTDDVASSKVPQMYEQLSQRLAR